MLITCQAGHNEHAINKTDQLTDCHFMTDYTVAICKSYKGENRLIFCVVHKIYFCMNVQTAQKSEVAPRSAQAGTLLLSDHKTNSDISVKVV